MLKGECLSWLGSCWVVLKTVSCLLSESGWADYVTTPGHQEVGYAEK